MKYNKENPLRVFEAFAGYGSQSLALKRLAAKVPGFAFTTVGISEIDAHAITAYNIIHGETANFGDISKIDWVDVPDFDLFTYSFPCTDISGAGLQRGLSEGSGTRSSLLWECRRAIDYKCPPVAYGPVQYYYRIRKLHPIETYRLMDVDDKDIEKVIGAVGERGKPALPKSAHYKLAGNSIVVSCMFHIFKALFCDETPSVYQTTLF